MVIVMPPGVLVVYYRRSWLNPSSAVITGLERVASAATITARIFQWLQESMQTAINISVVAGCVSVIRKAAVSSLAESVNSLVIRAILQMNSDENGAERRQKHGDMLYKTKSGTKRAQGCFIGMPEAESLAAEMMLNSGQ